MTLIWRKILGRPKHLMTITRAFGSLEQVSVNLYFSDAGEVDTLLKQADIGLNRKGDEFQAKLVAVEAAIKAKMDKASAKDKK